MSATQDDTSNDACHIYGHYQYYHPGILILSQVTAIQLKIVDFIYVHDLQMSCNDLITGQGTSIVAPQMAMNQDSSPTNGHAPG